MGVFAVDTGRRMMELREGSFPIVDGVLSFSSGARHSPELPFVGSPRVLIAMATTVLDSCQSRSKKVSIAKLFA